jgi:hypothetical protein
MKDQQLDQKAASVLRDDVTAILENLSRLYALKIEKLEQILANEKELSTRINTFLIEYLIEILNHDAFLIQKIDALDSEIEGMKLKCANIIGIEYGQFDSYIQESTHPNFIKINSSIEDIKTKLKKLRDIRDKNISSLVDIAKKTSKSIEELKRIDLLNDKIQQ